MVQKFIIFIFLLYLFFSANAGMIKRNIWYVKPVTGEYGLENGTSEDNAFDGFAGINWNVIEPNDYLLVCGNFYNEVLVVGKSGTPGKFIFIKGKNGYASIDGKNNQVSGIEINSKQYVVIQDIYVKNQTTNGFYNSGNSTNIIYKRSSSEYSGNQNFQNVNHAQSIMYNCQGNYGVDDGLSQHDTTIVHAYNCSFYGNAQNINGVSLSQLYIYNSLIDNGTQYGIWPSEYMNVDAYNCTIKENALALYMSGNGYSHHANFCNSTFTGNTKGIYFNNPVDTSTHVTLYGCYLTDICYNRGSKWDFWYTLINQTSANHILDCYSTSTVNLNYCVFQTIPKSKAAVVSREAGTIITSRNCVYYGSGTKVGTGISEINGTVVCTNSIFSNLNIGFQIVGGTAYSTNDCYFSNNTNTSGTITISNQVTTDPKFVVAGSNFSLNTGSSCINAGATLGDAYKYGLKNTTTIPNNILILNQNDYGNWEIGTYVHE